MYILLSIDMSLSKVVLYAGAVALSSLVLKILRFIRLYTRPSSLPRYLYNSSEGSKAAWALVTGASDGIGLGFANELAHRGFNVILHGRNPAKLEAAKGRLSKDYPGAEFRIVIADALQSTEEIQKALDVMIKSLADVHLTVLINNCGGTPPSRDPLFRPLNHDSLRDIDEMVHLNAVFPVQVTSVVLPLLFRHEGPSLIVNIGSIADMGAPWLTTYAGSKAFNMGWSKGLQVEMDAERRDVEVLGIAVGKVTAVTHCKEEVSLFVPDSRTFASAALDRVGCGRFVAVGYWAHALQKGFVDIIPEVLLRKMLVKTYEAERVLRTKKQ